MIKAARVVGLSAIIKGDGLSLEELEMLDKAAKIRVVKSYEAVKEQARTNEN